jgi:hypothetical protein
MCYAQAASALGKGVLIAPLDLINANCLAVVYTSDVFEGSLLFYFSGLTTNVKLFE